MDSHLKEQIPEIEDVRVYPCSVAESCPTLCNPWTIDCSPPSPSVHRISQARILEWVAVSTSRGTS